MELLKQIEPILIALQDIFKVVLVIFMTIFLANTFRKFFSKFTDHAKEDLRENIKQYLFLKHLITALIYLLGLGIAIYLIEPLRNLSLSLFAGSGILAVIVGFAAQNSLANIVSGIFITIFKPFRIEDRVKLTGHNIGGVIEDITLRHTIIRTFENKRVVVPNAIISTEVIENSNIVEERVCRFIEIGISYDSDIDLAMKVIQEEALNHPNIIDVRKPEDVKEGIPVVIVRLINFGESSMNLRAYVWAEDQTKGFIMSCDLNKSIKERFDLEGIVIPFPQRDLHIKSSNIPLGVKE